MLLAGAFSINISILILRSIIFWRFFFLSLPTMILYNARRWLSAQKIRFLMPSYFAYIFLSIVSSISYCSPFLHCERCRVGDILVFAIRKHISHLFDDKKWHWIGERIVWALKSHELSSRHCMFSWIFKEGVRWRRG